MVSKAVAESAAETAAPGSKEGAWKWAIRKQMWDFMEEHDIARSAICRQKQQQHSRSSALHECGCESCWHVRTTMNLLFMDTLLQSWLLLGVATLMSFQSQQRPQHQQYTTHLLSFNSARQHQHHLTVAAVKCRSSSMACSWLVVNLQQSGALQQQYILGCHPQCAVMENFLPSAPPILHLHAVNASL